MTKSFSTHVASFMMEYVHKRCLAGPAALSQLFLTVSDTFCASVSKKQYLINTFYPQISTLKVQHGTINCVDL